jgi:cytoskeleton protein RodZ
MMDFHSSFDNSQPVMAEISSEHLDDLVTQIEDELHGSQVYSLSLMNLQNLLGHAAVKGEILIRAVGREAIQIALKQMATRYHHLAQNPQQQVAASVVTVTPTAEVLSPDGSQTPSEPSTSTVDADTSPQPPTVQQTHPVEDSDTVVSPLGYVVGGCAPHHIKSTPPTSHPKIETPEATDSTPPKKKKKLTKAEIAAQKVQQRTNYLRQIGEQFQQARQALGLSQCELHRSTMVPLSHLEALEMAKEDQLPEDVYLRGFICRLGNALGLDGTAMAAALPAPDPLQSLTPSWSSPEPDTEFYLNPIHLYLGYAALLAGSIGGIALLSQQGIPENIPAPDVPDIPENTTQSHRPVEPELTPGLRPIETGVVIGADIVPPEALGSQSLSQSL